MIGVAPDLNDQFILENILDTSYNPYAKLMILNMSYHYLKHVFNEIVDSKSYLQITKLVIKKSYDLTTDDGICCVIATDDKNPQKNTLDVLGTKVIQDVDPWHVSDEIIWDKRSQETVANQKREELQAIDFEEIPFSQVWVLSKQETIPKRSNLLASVNLSQQKETEIMQSVWSIYPRSQLGYKDPLPSELLARLILLYSNPNDMVMDPFAGHGLVGLICKSFNRSFLCFVRNTNDLKTSRERLRKFNDSS